MLGETNEEFDEEEDNDSEIIRKLKEPVEGSIDRFDALKFLRICRIRLGEEIELGERNEKFDED